jgi:tetratricopeptide (TPR) repeat protein
LLDLLSELAPDDTRRVDLEFGRAEALVRAGDVDAARDAFLALAQEARSRSDAPMLARAALGFGQAFEAQARDDTLILLLEQALAALPPEDDATRSLLLARLGAAQYFTVSGERRDAVSRAAVEAATRSGEARLLSYAWSARYFALWGPDHLDERQLAARQALHLAEQTGDRELELDALTWKVMDAFELGDADAVDAAVARHRRLAEHLRHGRHRSYTLIWESTRAFLDGRLGDAEAAARHALAVGERLTPLARARYGAQLFFIRREQGRLGELRADAERILAEHSELRAGWVSLAGMTALARGDVGDARDMLEEVVASLDGMPFDANWLAAQVHASELCVAVGNPGYAPPLQRNLIPFANRCAVIRFAPGCLGSTARYVGLLAALQEDWDAACDWFDRALAANRRLRAATWVAHTMHEYALALCRRRRTGDVARAGSLRSESLATAQRLGLHSLARSIETLPS